MAAPAWLQLRKSAIQHLNARRFDPAERDLREAIAQTPAESSLYSLLARTLRGLRRFDAAANVLTHALALSPGEWRLHADLGQTLLQLSLYEGAEHVLRRAIDVNPGSERSSILLAKLLATTLRFEQAAALLSDLIGRHPEHDLAAILLGLCHFNLQNNHDALPYFIRAMALNPALADVHFHAGRTCLRLNRSSDCVSWMESAVALDPKLSERRNLLLQTLTPKALGDYFRAQ